MPILDLISEKKKNGGVMLKAILLVAQIALPFALYLALRCDSGWVAILIAVLILLGMILQVWLG
jgi:hypothetical protein